jgi:hypothetical protein
MADATMVAARETLEESLEAMRETIAGAAPEALNWRPAGDETNTMAVLAVHSMHSTRSWLCSAMGRPLPERDRPAEFRATAAGVQELLRTFDTLAEECRDLLATDAPFDAAALRPTHARQRPDASTTVTAIWALIHALEHLREHVAHMQLTLQLWRQEQSRAPR